MQSVFITQASIKLFKALNLAKVRSQSCETLKIQKINCLGRLKVLIIMAIWVVEFSSGGTKLDFFCLRINILKGNQKVSKFDFQSQFAVSKIIRIFLNFIFIEEYQFRSNSMLLTFFDNMNS